METLIVYLVGCLTVWVVDKRLTYDNGWHSKAHRLAVSLFSWISIVLFFVFLLFDRAAEWLERNEVEPIDWL